MSGGDAIISVPGWYVISLRPAGEHAGVRRAAAACGARTFALSTLRIEAQPAAPALAAALACTRVIVSSPLAVRHAQAQRALRARRGQQWFAIGAGSARALARLGIAAQTPARMDSEGLLALPELRELQGERVGLLTAPGGRNVLVPTLRRRGANVLRADVYRRVALTPTAARLRQLQALPARSALLVSSAEAFAALWQALTAAQQDALRQRAAVTSSARLAELLAQHGFARVTVAAGPRPQQLLQALQHAIATRQFR